MDLITLDASDAPGLVPGDTVRLLGPSQSVDDLADAAGTIGYEILTSLGTRYARAYVGASPS
jgi:alanine racemase